MIVTMHELVSFASFILNKAIKWFRWKSNNKLDFIDFFLFTFEYEYNCNHAKQNTLSPSLSACDGNPIWNMLYS